MLNSLVVIRIFIEIQILRKVCNFFVFLWATIFYAAILVAAVARPQPTCAAQLHGQPADGRPQPFRLGQLGLNYHIALLLYLSVTPLARLLRCLYI